MLYVVTKNAEGEFTGFCSEQEFNRNRDLYLLEGESYVTFIGPDYDGTDETFDRLKGLAHALCRPP